MTWYTFLLFVHVLDGDHLDRRRADDAALRRARVPMSGEPTRMAAVGEDIEWIANRLVIPASLLAFLTGVLLVIESDFYGFGDDWIVIALVLYLTTFLAGSVVPRPRVRAGSASSMRSGSPDAGPRTLRLIMMSLA